MKNRITKETTWSEVIFYCSNWYPHLHKEAEATTSEIKRAVSMTLSNFEDYMKAEDRVKFLRENWYI